MISAERYSRKKGLGKRGGFGMKDGRSAGVGDGRSVPKIPFKPGLGSSVLEAQIMKKTKAAVK
jgi:hypothetical protein